MSMSGDEMELHDPDVPWQRKLIIRLQRLSQFGIEVFAGTTVIFLTVILTLITIYGLPLLIMWLQG